MKNQQKPIQLGFSQFMSAYGQRELSFEFAKSGFDAINKYTLNKTANQGFGVTALMILVPQNK